MPSTERHKAANRRLHRKKYDYYADRQLPLEPLLAAIGIDGIDPLVERAGFSRRSWQRWNAKGEIHWLAGDGIAAMFGFHPLEIWPVEWAELGEEDCA